ncbi:hypothetical protein [Bacteroides sp.]
MKKQKKYTESVPAQKQCAHEPAVEYQAMRKELPAYVLVTFFNTWQQPDKLLEVIR